MSEGPTHQNYQDSIDLEVLDAKEWNRYSDLIKRYRKFDINQNNPPYGYAMSTPVNNIFANDLRMKYI